jgi:hypothetical protein
MSKDSPNFIKSLIFSKNSQNHRKSIIEHIVQSPTNISIQYMKSSWFLKVLKQSKYQRLQRFFHHFFNSFSYLNPFFDFGIWEILFAYLFLISKCKLIQLLIILFAFFNILFIIFIQFVHLLAWTWVWGVNGATWTIGRLRINLSLVVNSST